MNKSIVGYSSSLVEVDIKKKCRDQTKHNLARESSPHANIQTYKHAYILTYRVTARKLVRVLVMVGVVNGKNKNIKFKTGKTANKIGGQ